MSSQHHQYIVATSPTFIIYTNNKDRPLIRALESKTSKGNRRGNIQAILKQLTKAKQSKLFLHAVYPSIRIRKAVNQTTTGVSCNVLFLLKR